MMTKKLIIPLLLLLPVAAAAQTDVALSPEFGARMAACADLKLAKGLHLELEEEARMDNNLASFNRLQTTVALRYKLHPNIKLGLGYALIAPYSAKNSAFKSVRHRLMLDATGSLKVGLWRLSLKERLQATYRTGDMNEYQNPRTALALKSRLKVQYTGLRRLEPYASLELRNTLNAPVINALYNGSSYITADGYTVGEAGWFIDSFTGCYANRLRGTVGAEYRLDRRNRLDASIMLDWVNDKVVDANAAGTRLKSYTRERGLVGWLCVAYSYTL